MIKSDSPLSWFICLTILGFEALVVQNQLGMIDRYLQFGRKYFSIPLGAPRWILPTSIVFILKRKLKEKFTNLLHYNWLLGSYNLESRERISATYVLLEFRFLYLQQKSSVKWLAWKYYTKYCRLHSFHLKLLSMLDIRLGKEIGKDAHFYSINNNDNNNWKAPCAGAKSSCQVHQCDEGKIMYFNLIGKGTYLFAQSSTALHFLTLIKSFETSMLSHYLCMR